MAIRNFELDKKIINAANKEFLKEGFTKASLRRIAQKAGITTGALYTRYKNKNELFCSLVSDVCKKFDEQFTYLMLYSIQLLKIKALINMFKLCILKHKIF